MKSFVVFLKKGLILSIVAFVLYIILWFLFFPDQFSFSWLSDLRSLSYCTFFVFTSLGISYIFLRNKPLESIDYKRLLVNGILTFVFNILFAVFCETYLYKLFWENSSGVFWESIYIFCIIASLVAEIHILIYYTDLVIKYQEKNIALTKAVLKSQLNPHFVFNSLSILTGLIQEDPEKAENFLVSLSKIYRYIVKNIEKNVVSVEDAISFVRDYVFILQERYPMSITLEVDERGLDKSGKILAMSMQLLIENAVKHNTTTPGNPLHISVFRNGDYLVVRNNVNNDAKMPCDTNSDSSGVGLNNLVQRYKLECGLAPVIDIVERDGARYFEVSLPLIKS